MNDRAEPTPAVLAERQRHAEYLQKALELEVHDLRVELDARLRQSYLTTAEMRNVFITRDELQHQAGVRREWPLIAFSGLMAICNLVTLVVVLTKVH